MIFRLYFYVQQVNINLARNIMSIIFTNVLENRTEKEFVYKKAKQIKPETLNKNLCILATKSMHSTSLVQFIAPQQAKRAGGHTKPLQACE